VGLVELEAGETVEAALERADAQLYQILSIRRQVA